MLSTRWWLGALALLMVSLGSPEPAAAIGDPTKVPAKRWLKGAGGYEEAKDIQGHTGADMVVYFFRYDDQSQKGLCRWWEKYGLTGDVKKLLHDYIKVEMQLPFRKSEEELFSGFYFKSCPGVFVVWPDGTKKRVAVFDWPNGKPDLKDPHDLVAEILANSSPAMQERISGD